MIFVERDHLPLRWHGPPKVEHRPRGIEAIGEARQVVAASADERERTTGLDVPDVPLIDLAHVPRQRVAHGSLRRPTSYAEVDM